MRRCLRSLLVMLCMLPVFRLAAQPVNGYHTIGPGGDYPSLTAAIGTISTNGMSGFVLLEILPAYISNVETFPIVLANLPTTSANHLEIRPAPNSYVTISSSASSTFSFSNTSYVYLDGRPGGSSSGTGGFIIENTSPTGSAISFINESSANYVQFCSIKSSNATINSGTMVFGGTTGTNGNDYNYIAYNTFRESVSGTPANAIYCSGNATAGQENSNNSIINNDIINYFSADNPSCGILLSAGATDWTISTNKLYQELPLVYTAGNVHRGIYINGGNNYTVSNNTIGYSAPNGTGTYTMSGAVATTFVGIGIAASSTTPSLINNNKISGITLTSTSPTSANGGVLCGINVYSGDVNVSGNLIGADFSTGGGHLNLSAAANAALCGINSSSTGIITITNNTIQGLQNVGAPTAIATVYCIGIGGAAASMTVTGNALGSATYANYAGIAGVNTAATPAMGIFAPSVPLVSNYSNNIIQNLQSNGVGGGYVRGIFTSTTTNTTNTSIMNGNIIHNLGTYSALPGSGSGAVAAAGIHFFPGINSSVSGNTIYDISAKNNTVTSNVIATGIVIANATDLTVDGNLIYDIKNAGIGTATSGPVASGILIRSGNGTMNVKNNMISLGSGQTTNTIFIGICANHGSTPNPLVDNIYHNTINITGTAASGAQPSFCFYRGDLGSTTRTVPVSVKNNIFTNDRTGGTGKHYAICNNYGATVSATGWGVNASERNVLNAAAATIGYWGGDKDFASWKTSSSGDASSLSGVTVTYMNNADNLHLNMGTSATELESGALALASVTTDFDDNARPGPAGSVNGGGVAPDLGADEFDGVMVLTPVKLLSLSATAQDRNGIVSWNTASEANVSYYEIEASTDAVHFSKVGRVASAGNSVAGRHYEFPHIDAKVFAGGGLTVFYRLRAVDLDQSASYSKVVKLQFDAVGNGVRVYPNPVADHFTISIEGASDSEYMYTVTDMAGKIITSKEGTVHGAVQINEPVLKAYPAGSYYLKLNVNGALHEIKLMKL